MSLDNFVAPDRKIVHSPARGHFILRVRRHHIHRATFAAGFVLIAVDLLAAIGLMHIAEHIAHFTGASGATLTAVSEYLKEEIH